MYWERAASPSTPPSECEVVDVADALITPLMTGVMRTRTRREGWVTGAVYDNDGYLVPASQRWWNGDMGKAIAVDPPVIQVPNKARRLGGRWLYGGHMAWHFGHFMLETLPNLWPEPEVANVTGLIFHRRIKGDPPPPGAVGLVKPTLQPWHADFIELAGYGGLKIWVVTGRPVFVDALVVPTRPVLLKKWALPQAASLWQRVSATVGDRGRDRRIYLSRQLFNATKDPASKHVRISEAWEQHIEREFAAAGFTVVHPETLTIREQITVVRGADLIAGPSGSALHQSAFASSETRVIEIGDQRSPTDPMPSQQLIDAACGRLTAFVPYRDNDALQAVLTTLT